jgi:hypothetical protein
MSTIEQVFDALRDTVLDHLGGAGVAGNSKLIAFEPGTPIPDQSFRLGDEAHTLSPDLAREFMSAHADTFPEVVDSLFSRRMLTVENQYGVLLSGAAPIDPATTEMLGAVKRLAIDDFDVEIQALQPGMGGYRPLIATPSNWYDLSADGNWTTISIGAQDEPPPRRTPGRYASALTMWQTLPSTKRHILSKPLDVPLFEAMETPSFVGGNAPPDLVQPRRPGVQLRRPDAIDAHFLRQTEIIESPIVRVGTLTARQAAMKRNTTRVVAELAPEGLPNQRIDKRRLFTAQRLSALNDLVLSNATPKPVSTDSFSISFRLCLVQLHRPWLSQSLLALPGWYMPGFARGSLSDATSLTAPMSLVPTGCILIRDLSIKGQWTDDDRDALSNSASLGPLSLLGRNYDAGSASISVPGMQSIGWLCERMPVIPPAGDPNLPTA